MPRTFFPGENISAGEIQRTEPAGIWHFSDISILPLPLHSLYIHLLVNSMMALHKSLDIFLTMADWVAHNLLQGTESKIQNLRIFHLLYHTSYTLYFKSKKLHGCMCTLNRCSVGELNTVLYGYIFYSQTARLSMFEPPCCLWHEAQIKLSFSTQPISHCLYTPKVMSFCDILYHREINSIKGVTCHFVGKWVTI